MAIIKLKNSSSFRLATFFTILLVCSVAIIIYLISIANSKDFGNLNSQEIAGIINVLGMSIIIILFIVLAVAYFVSVYVVNLINKISNTADDIIKSGDLSRRIPVTHSRDDLSKLAYVLNSMFDQIENLLAGVRQVSDNIAHDLRTPLARLRSKIEKFEGGEGEKEALMKEADGLINIFNALLRIARIESGKEMVMLKLDIASVITDVVEFYEPLIEQKRQKLSISMVKAQVVGDKDLLFQMFANILDNAIKFAPKQAKIEVFAKTSGKNFMCRISNEGKALADEDRGKVFTRFYRVESSRNKEGHGLGLSLVKAVVEAHNGVVEIVDKDSGFSIEISLPQAA